MARLPTKEELLTGAVIVGVGEKIIDLITGGKLAKAESKVLWSIIKKAGPAVARGAVGAVPRVLGTARLIAMRHPYVAAGALIYVGVTEREKVRALLEQGYDIVEERLPTPSLPPSPGIPGIEEIILGEGLARRPVSEFLGPPRIPKGFDPMTLLKRPRRPSAFNRAVSAGMKAIKKSTSYGKKGTIKPAKKAFALVTKLASAKKKKKKAPKSGIRRRIWNAMKGLR